jgi:hypothetical protein
MTARLALKKDPYAAILQAKREYMKKKREERKDLAALRAKSSSAASKKCEATGEAVHA